MLNKLIYTPSATLEEAIRLLDQNGNGFLPVVSVDNKLIGIITDGDLRRGILNKKFDLESIINKHPIVEQVGTPHYLIKKRLKEIQLRQMPVVDHEGKLVEVVVLDEFEFVSKDNWVVIMAGGLGSRLGHLTKQLPKPMLSIGGKPILHGIIDQFVSQGFRRFVLCVNYKSEVIENYFGNGEKLGVEIRYTKENKRMGTAGALSLIDFEMNRPFFVINGDLLTTMNFDDLLDFHIVNNATATMCIKPFEFEIPYACIEFNENNDLLGIKEKPSINYFINTGIYVLEPETIQYVPKESFFDMTTLFQVLLENGKKTKVFTLNEYWLDIGNPEDFNKAQSDIWPFNKPLTNKYQPE
jgi:dTDP-glucose pyrophosphorylase